MNLFKTHTADFSIKPSRLVTLKNRDGFKRQSGFTMIELMVTILIMAILAAFAAPSFNDVMNKFRFEREARDLLEDIKDAKIDAIDNQKVVNLNIPVGTEDDITVAAESNSPTKLRFNKSFGVLDITGTPVKLAAPARYNVTSSKVVGTTKTIILYPNGSIRYIR